LSLACASGSVVETIAKKIYGADKISVDKKTSEKFALLEKLGFGKLPICMAKTQYSLSADPTLRCRPSGFDVPIRDVKSFSGRGFCSGTHGRNHDDAGLVEIACRRADRY
jgi:formyltetrahydrofolate synthetase